MRELLDIDAETILDSLGDGVYVTDRDRRIIYWNRAAERITGWRSQDIVGNSCFDNILAHVDKDGHHLCGKEYCPLHRAIVTGTQGECPLLFAKRKDGRRIPVHVTVAPIRNAADEVIGGVEVFRDISPAFRDLEKAKAIQSFSLQHDLAKDARVRFSTHYVPRDIVGGDYYGIHQLQADQYGFFLADVMGHGLAAALYTIHLSALWDSHQQLLATPLVFVEKINRELNRLVKSGEIFATGICGLVDVGRREIVFVGAGGPPAVMARAAGEFELIQCEGFPLGVTDDAVYESAKIAVQPGDSLLLFSDGVTEIHSADNQQLGTEGLATLLKKLGYPAPNVSLAMVEESLLKYSNAIQFEDDLTLIEIRFPG